MTKPEVSIVSGRNLPTRKILRTRTPLASAALLMMGILWTSLPAQAQTSLSPDLQRLLEEYQRQSSLPLSSSRGGELWQQNFQHDSAPLERNCTSCHGKDLTQPGLHVKTRKAIKPLAPSVNPERLTQESQMRKWLKRNCNWTLGRACTPQEKGDLLLWIQSQ